MARCEKRVVSPCGVGEQFDRLETVHAEYETVHSGEPVLARQSTVTTFYRRSADVEEFHLTLGRQEALFLWDVLQNIGGDSVLSRRRFSDAIIDALADVGFKEDIPAPDLRRDYPGGLYFLPQNKKDW